MTVRILTGDCRVVLPTLESCSVHTIVTSPPYYQLRSYLPEAHEDKGLEIGSEPTVEDWVETLVGVFRECRRVLRDDGTLWLNLGDSYAGSGRGGNSGASTMHSAQPDHSKRTADVVSSAQREHARTAVGDRGAYGDMKAKDLIGQPWLLAFALRADGWYLRQDIVWSKDNPMPESVRDRCTKAHEYIFLLSKSPRYFYNFAAMQEIVNGGAHARGPGNRRGVKFEQGPHVDGDHRTKGGLVAYADRQRAKAAIKSPAGWDRGPGAHGLFHEDGRASAEEQRPGYVPSHDSTASRKARASATVKSAPTQERNGIRALSPKAGLADSHNDSTTAPQGAYAAGKSEKLGRGPGWRKLAAIGSGTKNNGSFDDAMAVMPETRNPRSVWPGWEDEFMQFLRWKEEQAVVADVWAMPTHPFKGAHFATFPPELARRCILAGCPPGGTVLDIFGGAGTTGLVADRAGRNAILIELDERSVDMADARITADAPLFTEVSA